MSRPYLNPIRDPALILQHIDCETPGILEELLATRNVPYRIVRPYAGEAVPPDIAEAPALIVLGGPMGVNETDAYPFLKDEMRLIVSALKAERPILGICLGSQLLAAALGAEVRKGPGKEIGWFPVFFSAEAGQDALLAQTNGGTVLHWHGDVFDLPKGAVALASSDRTRIQAYRYGRNAYGFLFHMEATEPMLRAWVSAFSDELSAASIDPRSILDEMPRYLPGLHAIGKRVLGKWADTVSTRLRPAEAR